MITISVCMIVKNDEKTLSPLLSSISQFANEIIIVDLGSSDNTIQIAKQFTPHVTSFAFQNDFSAARNYSFSFATMDYIMWLDASDIIENCEINKLLNLKQNAKGDVDVYMFPYDSSFDTNDYCTLTYFREELIKREANLKWQEPVYEYIQPTGNVIKTDIHIKHIEEYATDNTTKLDIYNNLLAKGIALSARSTYYFAKELAIHDMNDQAIDKYLEFLDMESWDEDKIAACFELSFCYEKTNNFKGMISSLLASFEYSTPRAEICCRIGDYFTNFNKFEEAIYWYEMALTAKAPESWGFVQVDYYGYIPHLWLCVLYYQLEDYEKAKYHNECAAKIKPDDASVLYNINLLNSL